MDFTVSQLRYLAAIYELAQQNSDVSSKKVVDALGVSKPAVTKALDDLMRHRLLVKERYGKIYLTNRGFFVARFVGQQVGAVLAHFPPMAEETTEEERRLAALALVAALPQREFRRAYAAICAHSQEDEERGEHADEMPDAVNA